MRQLFVNVFSEFRKTIEYSKYSNLLENCFKIFNFNEAGKKLEGTGEIAQIKKKISIFFIVFQKRSEIEWFVIFFFKLNKKNYYWPLQIQVEFWYPATTGLSFLQMRWILLYFYIFLHFPYKKIGAYAWHFSLEVPSWNVSQTKIKFVWCSFAAI